MNLDDEEDQEEREQGQDQARRDRREGEAGEPDALYERELDRAPNDEDAIFRRLLSRNRRLRSSSPRQNPEVHQRAIQQHLVQQEPPSVNDFPLWRIRCRKGIEMDAVFHLGRNLEVQWPFLLTT